MSDASRSAIMARVRHSSDSAQGGADAIQARLESLGDAPVAALPSPDLGVALLANVMRNQGTADCASSKSDAVKAIARFLYQNFRTKKLAAGNDPRLAAMPWRDGGVLPRFGSAENGELAALSYARLAVAETGSVVTWTGRANPAQNNLLPEAHMVLVDRADLVATMEQAWETINRAMTESGRPRGINFISGPSSTADIDMELVKGAHGPRSWHVILIGEDAASTLEEARQLAGIDPA